MLETIVLEYYYNKLLHLLWEAGRSTPFFTKFPRMPKKYQATDDPLPELNPIFRKCFRE